MASIVNRSLSATSNKSRTRTSQFYRRAAERRTDLLADRGVVGRRFSVDAASNRAASESKADVGPFQRNWSTSSKSAMSVRRVASVRKSNARSRSRLRVSARALALAAFTRHSRQSVGMDSIWRNLPRTAAEDFAPQPGRPGYLNENPMGEKRVELPRGSTKRQKQPVQLTAAGFFLLLSR